MPTPSTSGLHGHLLAPVVTFRQDDSKSERRSCCCALLAAQLLYAATFFALLRKQLVCFAFLMAVVCLACICSRISLSAAIFPPRSDRRKALSICRVGGVALLSRPALPSTSVLFGNPTPPDFL